MSEPNYGRAFQDGLVMTSPTGDNTNGETEHLALRTHILGKLVVTSGKIVACDPLIMPDELPFADTIAPGRYPVIISVAELAANDECVAFALLRLSERPAVRWENAAPQGKNLVELEPNHVYRYGVDTGTGCFMDADAAQALQALANAAKRGDHEDDSGLMAALLASGNGIGGWQANFVLDEATGANVIAFTYGLGDGFYPSFWGYDASGQRVALVTDFEVIDAAWLTQL